MKPYKYLSPAGREEELQTLRQQYQAYVDKELKLDMTRGKPGEDQLDLSMPMLDILSGDSDCRDSTGFDCRNYGMLQGIEEARRFFGEYLGVQAEETIVIGSSSLSFIYDSIARAMLAGVLGGGAPWSLGGPVSFLCPVPGYDRHFTICEFLGIEMIPVPMNEDGPDVEEVKRLVRSDERIKGMFCVPKYSNPLGNCYSDDVVRALASMETAAPDFRLFVDNAYNAHYVYRDVPVLNFLEACKEAGNPHRPYLFGSTSKITFPGAGVGVFGASRENIEFTKQQINAQTISWDKLNMLRHVRFFKDQQGLRAHMKRQADLLRPKFDIVLDSLEKYVRGTGAGEWIRPDGGYFVTFLATAGCASRVHELCSQAGVSLTPAGATHPYHDDPDDRYLRIAPSYPPVEELAIAMEVFCTSARIATLESMQ